MVGSGDSRVGTVRKSGTLRMEFCLSKYLPCTQPVFSLVCSNLRHALGHPVLQIFGWMLGTLFICIGLTYRSLMAFVLWAFLGIILGGGLVAVGNCLSKFYSFICFYMKRLWIAVSGDGRMMKKSRSTPSTASTGVPSEEEGNRPSRGTLQRRKRTTEPNV